MEIVLTTDQTLLSEFRNLPLGNFLSCVPSERVPEQIYNFIGPYCKQAAGSPLIAPYGLRKIEAVLNKRFNVKTVHPKHLNKFINEKTKIVAVYTMDPLGIGPVSLMFTGAGTMTAYTAKRFSQLMLALNKIRDKNHFSFKIIAGGPGVWELKMREEKVKEFKIDFVVEGETEQVITNLFERIVNGEEQKQFIQIKSFPRIEEIPVIENAAASGLIEVMRGCGRGCKFCEVTLRATRYIPFETIAREIAVNYQQAKHSHVFAHSDDIFMYKCEDKRTMIPNNDALTELFSFIMSQPGVKGCNSTHGTLAGALAGGELIPKLSKIMKASPGNWIGLQVGLETGSTKLAEKVMPLKMKPFAPSEWRQVVIDAQTLLSKNYWFPAYTLITGLPGETSDDIKETIEMINEMESIPNAHFTLVPLAFVPIGVLRGKEIFNSEEFFDSNRIEFIYRCWKHNVMEVNGMLLDLIKNKPLPLRYVLFYLSKFGSEIVLRKLEKFKEKVKRKEIEIPNYAKYKY